MHRVHVDGPVGGEGDGLEETLGGLATDEQVPAVAAAQPLDVGRRRAYEGDVPQPERLPGPGESLGDALGLLLAALPVVVRVEEAHQALGGWVAVVPAEGQLLGDQGLVVALDGGGDGWVLGGVGLQGGGGAPRAP